MSSSVLKLHKFSHFMHYIPTLGQNIQFSQYFSPFPMKFPPIHSDALTIKTQYLKVDSHNLCIQYQPKWYQFRGPKRPTSTKCENIGQRANNKLLLQVHLRTQIYRTIMSLVHFSTLVNNKHDQTKSKTILFFAIFYIEELFYVSTTFSKIVMKYSKYTQPCFTQFS